MTTLFRVYLFGIGCLFQFTAITHALNASELFGILREHAVIPSVTVVPAAVLVIVAEWAVGLACFVGVARRAMTAWSTVVVSMFVLILTGYLAALALFGGDPSDCGCGIGPTYDATGAIVRNGVLLAIPAFGTVWWVAKQVMSKTATQTAAPQQIA